MQKYLIWDFGKQFAREPVLRRMKNGDLICTFLTGGPTEPHNENMTVMSRSTDDGKTWSRPETIIRHSSRGVWCTELFTECERPFLVVMTYNAECHYRELETFRSFTDDDGRTWREPVSFPNGLTGVTLRQGIVMSNHEWLFPMYWQETRGRFDWQGEHFSAEWPFCCAAAVSCDEGATFQRFGYLKNGKGLWEPNCVEWENGHIIMLMRDNECACLKRSDSYDYGRTWCEPFTTDIENPNTKLTLLKVKEKILLINNFNRETGWSSRTHLEVRVSGDGLKSFSRKLPLENSEECWFYPHAFADSSRKMVYIAYENAHEHRLAKISFDELGLT